MHLDGRLLGESRQECGVRVKVNIDSDEDLGYITIEVGQIPARDFWAMDALAYSIGNFLHRLSIAAIIPDDLSSEQEEKIVAIIERAEQALLEGTRELLLVSYHSSALPE
jgi:hypothetical protein